MRILHVVGARPNFPKVAPVYRAAREASMEQFIVHTGQHYDDAMSDGFFRSLELPAPDVNLGVGSSSHAIQTAQIMQGLEPVFGRYLADWVVVYGDVNSTVAATLVAAKMRIPTAHVEAGLRSGDRRMPEEINRLVTDRLASLLLTPSRDTDANLRAEGESIDKIVFVGNVMIDSMRRALPAAQASGFRASLGFKAPPILVTLHRPSNVDDGHRLRRICEALSRIAEEHPVLFTLHPRTEARLKRAGCTLDRVMVRPPLSYLEMLDVMAGAHCVVTDSGGVQEETTALGIPCLTLRENTERPITITEGTNRLVPEPEDLVVSVRASARAEAVRVPEGWDGHAGERVAEALLARGHR